MLVAASHGHRKVVSALITANAQVDGVSGSTSALCMAVTKGFDGLVSDLIQAGADIDKPCKGVGYGPLHIAAHTANLKIISMLVMADAQVNMAAEDGYTPLLAAAQDGNAAVVSALIQANADVNQPETSIGASPLYIGAEHGHLPVVAALLKANAQVDQATNFGKTPFDVASHNGHHKVARALSKAAGKRRKAEL